MNNPTSTSLRERFEKILPPPKSEDEYLKEWELWRSFDKDMPPATATEFGIALQGHQATVKTYERILSFIQSENQRVISEIEERIEKAREYKLADNPKEVQIVWEGGRDFVIDEMKSLLKDYKTKIK